MSISVFVHIRQFSPSEPESIKGQAFFVNATTQTTFAGLYRIVSQAIQQNIPLRNELAGKSWHLDYGVKVIPNTPKKQLGTIARPNVSSLDISLLPDQSHNH